MMKMIKQIYIIVCNRASIIKSIYYNFKYLPLQQARFLPMIIAHGVHIYGNGTITLQDWDLSKPSRIYIGGKALKWMSNPSNNKTTIFINGNLRLKPGFYFGSGGGIEVEGLLSFGENFNATGKCTIICRNNISFGDDNLISWDTLIMDSDQHILRSGSKNGSINYDGKIKIGNHVWISSNVNVLKNTIVADGCVVGCNTLLHGAYKQENALIAGIPAKRCKENIEWNLEKPGQEPQLEIKEVKI